MARAFRISGTSCYFSRVHRHCLNTLALPSIAHISRWQEHRAVASQRHPSTPVLMLSGFLGAGKTTLLDHLLNSDHGLKLGVLVNDLASVNVDAKLLETSVQRSGARTVELSNGCVCCSATEDLRQGMLELLGKDGASRSLDAIVVELSGVAEPQNLQKSLDWLGKLDAHLACTVTVVDTPAFASDFNSKPPKWRGELEPGKERLSSLLAEQLESADVILLNKVDIASPDDIDKTKAVAKALNKTAMLYVVEHSRVAMDALLGSACSASPGGQPPDPSPQQEGHGHGHVHDHEHCHDPHCTDPNHDHSSSAERRFGITSFIYAADRPFSRNRLLTELEAWQSCLQSLGKKLELKDLNRPAGVAASSSGGESQSLLSPVLRSKGLLWIDSQPREALQWSHAGQMIRFRHWGYWGDSSVNPPAELGRAAEKARLAYEALVQADLGPARNELVFIGSGMDETAMRKMLDKCLLTPSEFEALQMTLGRRHRGVHRAVK